ncbi:hypothetical protein C7M84_002033 [Penaeus vannamei]|uniref:RNA-directed DNA polymerase n=1 Tax=Penaeus vannamei TaxID=6689 RepID=A0A3R7T1V0_PENVA|nr:hypothetical protein C7M84_002033 [Penaeus vannamei]
MWLGGVFFGQNNVGHRPTEHNRNHNEALPGTMMMRAPRGATVLAFLDSGSEATVVKEFCFRRISNTPLSPHPRGLRGASGAALDIKAGQPGPALLALMESDSGFRSRCRVPRHPDIHEPEPCSVAVVRAAETGKVRWWTGLCESDTAKVLVPRSLVDLSQPEVDVWLVNDQIVPVEIEQGFVLCYAAIVEVSLDRLEFYAESMDQDSGVNPEDVGSSSGGALDMASSTPIDDGSEPDSLMADLEDRFDFVHGLNDFGYNTDEFEVFPVCSFENEELPSSAGAVDLVERHQRDNPLWQQLIEYLEEGRLPPRRIPLPLDQFELRDRVLYHVKSDNERALLQLVIPRSLRGAALDALHAVPSAGHQGVHRTYQQLRDHFYFPGMLAASRRYVALCTACQRRKGAIARTPLQSMPDVAEPFDRVSVDILTLTPSARGNKYVLVLTDRLTRFVELFPLASKDAQTVADVFLAEFVTRYGPPRTLLSDNGLEFRNRLLSDICHHLQVKSLFTQANGMVERSNKVAKEALATLTERHPLEWHQYVPQVRLALNSAFHRSVGDQPLYLLMGHHGHFPVGLSNGVTFATDAVKKFHDALQEARYIAVETSRRPRET